MREFAAGARMLAAGIGYWRRAPGAMARGLIPAVVVALVFSGLLIALAIALPGIVTWATPFADGWSAAWATTLRIALGVATFGGALVLTAVTFTAATLVVGEPFYDRIWRAVEQQETGGIPDAPYGVARAAGDALGLVVRGVGAAILAWLLGLIPLIGAPLGLAAGITLTGWLLADELTSRALTARGIDRRARRALLRRRRGRALGFGVATQACFLVPLGAVVIMPAAVAGSTLLAQQLLSESSSEPVPAPRG
jgi:CysZ protein